MLPANGPILKALRLPRTMGITRAGAVGIARQLAELDAALADGLRLVQVREPALGAGERADFAGEVLHRARPYGALVLINSDIDLAARIGADGVHLPGRQLAGLERRPQLPWVGASCHTRPELERAAALSLDYAVLGPLRATPTHPDTPGIGLEAFAALVDGLPLPVFALGGVSGADMEMVRDAGAHGIAAIRAAWERPR
jgi:8-oxo-dGTP diphosphatase